MAFYISTYHLWKVLIRVFIFGVQHMVLVVESSLPSDSSIPSSTSYMKTFMVIMTMSVVIWKHKLSLFFFFGFFLYKFSYTFSLPTISSKPVDFRLWGSRDDMIWMNLYLRSPFKNFFNFLDFFYTFSPNKDVLDDKPNFFSEKSSTESLSSIFNLSNSDINVWSLASYTRSAQRCHDLMASHITFDVVCSPTWKIKFSWTTWNKRAFATFFITQTRFDCFQNFMNT